MRLTDNSVGLFTQGWDAHGVRKVIPSCVVSEIRRKYPSKDGIYTGFREGFEVPETDFSWTNEHIDEE